jgi:hypothetical protein
MHTRVKLLAGSNPFGKVRWNLPCRLPCSERVTAVEKKHAKVEICLLAGCWPGFACILAL